MKKIIYLTSILLLVTMSCTKKEIPDPVPESETEPPVEEFDFNGEAFAKAATMIKDGDVILAPNPNAEKFLAEVNYPDKDYTFTKIYDYYGGFNQVKYNEKGEPDPEGKIFNKKNQPVSDKPSEYSIRWKPDEEYGSMTLTLKDNYGWEQNTDVTNGSCYVNITNLVPNTTYAYTVKTKETGKTITEGTFNTTGHVHQVFFKNTCRNARDLGGWTTLDGKTVQYRKIYRGGRLNDRWSGILSAAGKKEVLAQGIGAQLELRGNSDKMSEPAVDGLDFLAPSIEQGGLEMLVNDAEKTKQCFEYIVNELREGKGVYYHCSLGRDRTGTLTILLLGLLGVREGDISKEYELTYFAPEGYSISSSEIKTEEDYYFLNTRSRWVYSDVAPYFWGLTGEGGTFAEGVEKYLLSVAKVEQNDIDDFRKLMLY